MRSRQLITTSLLAVWCVSVAAQETKQASSSANPAVEAALTRGEAALQAQQYKEALAAFRRASDLEKRKSAPAFFGMSRAYRGLRNYKQETQAAREGISIAITDSPPRSRLSAQLYNQLGLALSSQAKKPTDPEMKEAAQSFYWALTLSNTIPIAWFNLGVALLQQGQDDAGREALDEYIKTGPETAEAELARKYIAEPQLARAAFGRGMK